MYQLVKLATPAVFAVALVTVMPLTAAAVPADGMTGPVAHVDLGTHQAHWSPLADYAGLRLTISGPEGVEELAFGPGESPSFDLASMSGVADGLYSWELRAAPKLDTETKKLLAQMRSEDSVGTERQRPAGLPAADQLVQSGTFRVLGGVIVQPAEEAPAPALRVQGAGADHVTGDLGVVTGETVISGDLTVYNSLCVGFDCLTSETYGADTIRLKENNLRIHVDDTSTAGSFPSTDWRLEFNSNLNGGASYFRVIDVSASRSIMTLEANAPSHSLYVDSSGRVGFGTQNPVLELHVSNGDTPALRLEQNTSSGFAAQSWDVAGNETSFFVRDATGGSTLPFRIFPGMPSSSLVLRNDNVGMGTTSPTASVHVLRGSSESAKVLVEDTGGDTILNMMELKNAGEVRFAVEDTSASSRRWEFRTAGPNFQFTRSDAPSADVAINTNGDLTVRGTLTVGPGGCTNCDLVFSPDYKVESIEDHAAYMWANSHLPGVGPTPEDAPMNLSKKTGGILNELEKAHIYIEQLNDGLKAKAERIQHLEARLATLEAELSQAPTTDTEER